MRPRVMILLVAVALLTCANVRAGDDAAPAPAPPAAAPAPPAPKDAAKEPSPPPSVTVIGARDAHGILGRDVRSSANEDMGRIVDVIVDRDDAAPAPAPPAAAPAPPAPKDAAKEPSPPPSVTVIGARDAHGILGRDVRSSANEDMGRIVDVIVDRDGKVRAAVIDFGGFLGVGSRKIVVDWNALRFAGVSSKSDSITLDLNKQQVSAAPEYKEDTPLIVLGAAGNLHPWDYEH